MTNQSIQENIMTNELAFPNNDNELLSPEDANMLKQFGQAADKVVAENKAINYREKKSENTKRAHDNDLQKFSDYIFVATGVSIEPSAFYESAKVWEYITHGTIETFRQWLLKQAYAINTVNRSLSTVRKYAELAFEAGYIDETKIFYIRTVKGFTKDSDVINLDRNRLEQGIQTRKTDENGKAKKKARWVTISNDQADYLLAKIDTTTPQGRRDSAIMHLLLHHGMRASEVANLKVGDINLETWEMKFDVVKTKVEGNHVLFPNSSLPALKRYIELDASDDKEARLFRGSKKNGELVADDKEARKKGITTRTISRIVNGYGKEIGLSELRAHDCRHYAANFEARNTRDLLHMMDMFNWKTESMARNYIEETVVKNEKSARFS